MAVAETVTSFILLPLEHLGRGLGKFFSALTGELSWFNSPFVLLFVFLAILLVIMMTFRYKIDLPFWIGSFGPSVTTPVTAELRLLQAKCQALTEEKDKLLLQEKRHLALQLSTCNDIPKPSMAVVTCQTDRVQEIDRATNTADLDQMLKEIKEDRKSLETRGSQVEVVQNPAASTAHSTADQTYNKLKGSAADGATLDGRVTRDLDKAPSGDKLPDQGNITLCENSQQHSETACSETETNSNLKEQVNVTQAAGNGTGVGSLGLTSDVQSDKDGECEEESEVGLQSQCEVLSESYVKAILEASLVSSTNKNSEPEAHSSDQSIHTDTCVDEACPLTPLSLSTPKGDEGSPETEHDNSFLRQLAAAEAEAMLEDSYEILPAPEDQMHFV